MLWVGFLILQGKITIIIVDIVSDTNHAIQRFTSSKKQCKILNDLADLLTESSQHFGKVTADFIVHSALKFITGLILEVQSKQESVSTLRR